MNFEEIAQRLEGVLERANERLHGEAGSASGHPQLLAESVGEFSAALEQLQVMSEEMQRQNDELIATRASVEAERRRYQELFELAPGGYIVTDALGTIREANRAAKSLVGVPRHKLEGKPLIVFVEEEYRHDFRLRLAAMAKAEEPVEWVIRLRSHNGQRITTALKCVPVRDRQGGLSALQWLLRDITEQQRAQALLSAQKSVLEKIARGLPLADALDALCRFVEEQLPGRLCSVLLHENGRLRFGAAPSLPGDVNRAVDGQKIGPFNGACGTAAYLREAVVVRDVATDPLCADLRDLLLSHGLRSCASTPVFAKDGEVLACFAIYGREAYAADPRFPPLIEVATDLAGIAIQRMLSEKALAESEDRYRDLVENSQDLICTHDLEGRVLSVNQAALKVLGYSPTTLTEGGNILDLIAPEFRHKFKDYIATLRRDGTAQGLMLVETRNGERRIWEYNNSLRTVGVATPVVRGIAHDVTERKRAEDELRRSELRLAETQQIAHVGSWEWDLVANTGNWSNESFRIFGFAPRCVDITYDRFLERLHPDDGVRLREVVLRALEDRQPFTTDCRIRLRDGAARLLQVRGKVIVDEAGTPVKLVGSAQDVTDRSQAEEALGASEERYRVFVEQSSEAIWRFELEEPMSIEISEAAQIEHCYKYAYLAECNDAMARMYARSSAEEMVGKRLGDLLEPSYARNIDYLQEFIRSGYRMVDSESHETDAEGKKRYFLNNLVGVVEDGRLVRAWGTQRDVSGQKSAQEEINQRNRQLAALNATSAAVSRSLKLSSVLAALKQLLVEQMEIPGGGIYLYDEADDVFHLQADWGLSDDMLSKLKTYPASGFYGDQNVLRQEAILSLEFGESSAFSTPRSDAGEEAEWQSYLRVPLVAQGRIQGIAALLGATPMALSLEQINFFKALGQQVGVAIQNARLFEQVSAAQERMRMLSRRLVEVQEDERRHIARELHDQVGQSLTGLILQLELCRRLPPAALTEGINNAQALANELIAQVRNLSLILRPTVLDDLGLLPALLWHFERYTDSTGIRVVFEHAGLERRFPAEVETAAYRVAQEALTNVARHTGVREATVHVWANQEVLCVQVEDRGAGFDPKAALKKHTSIGLAGMRERALLLGGQLTVESAAGKGAHLTAEFPLTSVQHASARR